MKHRPLLMTYIREDIMATLHTGGVVKKQYTQWLGGTNSAAEEEKVGETDSNPRSCE